MLIGGMRFQNATQTEKLLYIAGVPQRYWDADASLLTPTDLHYEKQGKIRVIRAEQQNRWKKRITTIPAPFPFTCCLSSKPTDELALIFAADLIRQYMKSKYSRVLLYNMDGVDPLDEDHEGFDLLALHNIVDLTDQTRLRRLRDILVRYDDVPKLVIVGGINPLCLFGEKLQHPLDAVFYFAGKIIRSKRNV